MAIFCDARLYVSVAASSSSTYRDGNSPCLCLFDQVHAWVGAQKACRLMTTEAKFAKKQQPSEIM